MQSLGRLFAVAALLAATAAPLRAANIHVSPAGGGDGSAASPTDFQTALTTAATNGESDAIFLQSGTYPAAATFTFAVETVTFDSTDLLVSGGWNAGFTAQTPDRSSVLDGQGARRVLKVTAQGAGANVTVSLENLTVRNGWTNEYAAPPGDTGSGAGILALNLEGAQLKLLMRQCALLDNVALEDSSRGGGLAISCDHELRECVFGGNRAEGGGAIHQSAAAPYTQALAPLIDGCAFQDNFSVAQGGSHLFTDLSPVVVDSWFYGRPGGSSSGGGAVNVINGGHPTFERCEFSGNVADHWGGAINFSDAGAEILGCLFEGNAAGAAPGSDGRGGALTLYDPDGAGSPRTVTVVNSTFVGNRVLGSLAYGGAIYNRIQTLVVHNSIFWDNGSPDFQGSYRALYRESGAATVSFSDIQGGLTSTGFSDGGSNITTAPYTGGPWGYPYRLLADSPCVDAGSNAAVPAGLISDREDHPRIFGGHDPATRVVDMGADEYYNGVFLVTVPSKNTSWLNNGAAKTIAWTCTNIPGDVRLSLWRESPAAQGVEVAEIAASVPCAAQSRGWTLPAGLPDGLDYAVVLQSLEMAALVEWNYVAIQHLHLKSPNLGSLLQGAKYPLEWESSGLAGADVRIELYARGARVRTIAAAAPNTGSYLWAVPFAQAPGPGFQIRIATVAPLAAEDFSDEPLRILPAVALTAPNGGQTWKRGRTYRIAWTYKNNPGTAVRIDLYKGGVFNRTIAASAPIGAAGKGSYLWRIPATLAPAATYTVRVRSAKYPNCFDFGNKAFTIAK